jgi:hypothetical protein
MALIKQEMIVDDGCEVFQIYIPAFALWDWRRPLKPATRTVGDSMTVFPRNMCQEHSDWTASLGPIVWIKQSSPATRHEGAWGERKYSSYSFLTSALDGGEWSASHSGRSLPPEKGPRGTHCTGWVDPRAGLDTEVRGKILCLCRGSNLESPVVQSVVRHVLNELPRLFNTFLVVA